MIICLVFWHTYRIPQLSDDPAAIWRSCSHFVKHYDPRVRLLDGPHGHLDIIMVEVPILLFQPYTSPSAMVKAGLTTVNSKWFNGVWRLFGHGISNGDLSKFWRRQGTQSNQDLWSMMTGTIKLVMQPWCVKTDL
jgi:hypothetical protein